MARLSHQSFWLSGSSYVSFSLRGVEGLCSTQMAKMHLVVVMPEMVHAAILGGGLCRGSGLPAFWWQFGSVVAVLQGCLLLAGDFAVVTEAYPAPYI
ncbi:hypothetical protein J6590_099408 [Homalodisca vitripennis]|nr:hypothetical protein J6590_099408 [Homalodisca vitripennis]